MKAYTSLEQSKKLAEILPLESADHHYVRKTCDFMGNPVDGKWSTPKYGNPQSSLADYLVQNFTSYEKLPCWSLAALLDVLPKSGKYEPFIDIRYNRIEYHAVDDEIEDKDYLLCYTDGRSLLDACYEMIIKLHEQKIL